MRKVFLAGLMAAVAIPTAAAAQSGGELRRDREEIQEQRDDLRDAQLRGDRGDIREEQHDVREAREELREDRQDRRDIRNDRDDRRDARDGRWDRRNSQYVAPYRNWSYSTVRPGYQLRRGFYGSRYYVANYRQYRLHPAARNQRWVHYGDDLLLVNVRTGRVLQVVQDRY